MRGHLLSRLRLHGNVTARSEYAFMRWSYLSCLNALLCGSKAAILIRFKSNPWFACWLGVSWTRNQITLNLHGCEHAQCATVPCSGVKTVWHVTHSNSQELQVAKWTRFKTQFCQKEKWHLSPTMLLVCGQVSLEWSWTKMGTVNLLCDTHFPGRYCLVVRLQIQIFLLSTREYP
jgi:hypothetical protein